MKSYCAPKLRSLSHGCSCFSKKQLILIKDAWNSSHDIKITGVNMNTKKCDIWKRLNTIINANTRCSNEQCWIGLQQLANISKIIKEKDVFRPLWPNEWFSSSLFVKKYETNNWLSSNDIWNVLRQYEHRSNNKSNFIFLGVVPIDFNSSTSNGCIADLYKQDEQKSNICLFNLNKLPQNINKFGIIFNTAPDGTTGEHWISLFCSLKTKRIIYFDSVGLPPPTEVTKFINKIQNQCVKQNIKMRLIINTKTHQKGNSECGMYAINFMVNMINDISWTKYNKKRINDEQMIIKRQLYFNKYT